MMLRATVCMALLLVCSSACQPQPKNNHVVKPADKQSSLNKAKTPKTDTKTAPKAPEVVPPKAVIEAAKLAEKAMMEHVGMACVNDMVCPRYLRCYSKKCVVPPAMTGKKTDTTPVAILKKDKQVRAKFFLELATDDEQRARGLMFRRSMKDDWGMLFIYPTDGARSFWMRNTLIYLDMVFISSDGTVVGVVPNAVPLTETPRRVGKAARYVLELNTGLAAKHGITPGVKMTLQNVKDEFKPK